MKPLVLCLGSDIVSDDGFGPAVATRLREDATVCAAADVEAAALAGFALLDLLHGRPRVLVVDAARGIGAAPGTLRYFPADALVPTHNLTSSHQVSLPVALALGRELGYAMPATVDVLACEAGDLTTLAERLTPPVAEAVTDATAFVSRWVSNPGGEP